MEKEKKPVNKKLILLYVLDLLEKGTSREQPTTVYSMTRVLNSLGVECERRTVSRNVGYLIAYGKPIVKLPGGRVYYDREKEN